MSYSRYNSDYDDDYYGYSRYQSSSRRSKYDEKDTNENISKTIIFKPTLNIKPSLDSTNINTSKKPITFKPYMIDNAIKSNYIFLDERIKLGKNGNKLYEFKKYYNNIKKNKFTLINILTSSTIYLDFIKWLLTTYKKNIQDVFIDKPKGNDKELTSGLDKCNEYFSDLLNVFSEKANWNKLRKEYSPYKKKIQDIIKKFIENNNINNIYLSVINDLIDFSTTLIHYDFLKKKNIDKEKIVEFMEIIDKIHLKLSEFIKKKKLLNDDIIALIKKLTTTPRLPRVDIKTLQKDSKDLFKEIINIIKNKLDSEYIENLIKNYKDSIKIYTDIFLKQESILTIEKVKYTIIEIKTSIADQDKEIKSHINLITNNDTSKISFIEKNITLTLIPEKDDQWKSYSGDCKTQRTRINNIFNALFKNTTNAIGIGFGTDINVFTRSSTDEDAWDKIYKQININPINKGKTDLETLRKKRTQLSTETDKLYYNLKRDIDRLSNRRDITKDQEKSLRDLLNKIRKHQRIKEEEEKDIENARSRFKIDIKQIINKQIDMYTASKKYYKTQKEELDKIMNNPDTKK